MTDRSLKFYLGEDLSPVADVTDLVKWEEAEFGTRAWRGESTNTDIPFRDEQSRTSHQDNLPAGLTPLVFQARNTLEFVHGSNVLWRGRIANQSYTRGAQKAGRAREGSAYLEDINIDLRGIVVHGWSRPAETDVARLHGLIAAYLSGSPRRSTIVNGSNLINAGSNVITLPAKVYNQTDPRAVIEDVATQANKTYYLLPRRRTTDAHTAELYYDGNDAVMELCPFRISDHPDEVKAQPDTVFAPIWNVGAAGELTAQETLSGVWLFYGQESYVHVSDSGVADITAHWEEVIYDDTVTTEAEALSKANAIIQFRRSSVRRINVTIGPLGDQHIDSIRAGQRITIQAMAVPWADDQRYDANIGQLKITTPLPGIYFAHLELERPLRMGPYGAGQPVGPKPPSSGTPGTPATVSNSGGDSGSSGFSSIGVTVDSGAGALYMAWLTHTGVTTPSANYVPDAGGTEYAMTLLETVTHTTNIPGSSTKSKLLLYRLASPVASTLDSPTISVTFSGTPNGSCLGYWVTDSDETPTVVSEIGVGVSSSVNPSAGASDLVLDVVGWRHLSFGNASVDPTPESGQTEDWSIAHNASAGQHDGAWGGAHKVGAGARGWSWGSSEVWVAAAIVIPGGGTAGDTTEPVGETGSGTPGDNLDIYAPLNHVHEHGDLTDASPYHDADQVSIDDAGGYFSGETVEAALQELGADIGAGGGTTESGSSALFPDSTITATKDSGNPTFNFDAIPENIVKIGDTYYAVYQDTVAEPAFGLASSTSRDGPWTGMGASVNPIFSESDCTWKAADTDLYAPEIVEHDGTFYLFYSVADDDDGTNGAIGVATAPQITGPYTDHGSAILTTGAAGAWDSLRVGEPSVKYHDGHWVMAYMGEDTDAAYQDSEQVGIATADDPTGPWTKHASNPVLVHGSSGEWDDELIADPFIFFENGYYWMLYSGGGAAANPHAPWILGLAYALDPTGTWTKHADNPIVSAGGSGAFDEGAAWRGSIWIEDGLISGIYGGAVSGLGTYKGGNFRLTVTAPSAGSSELDDLSDVAITSPEADQQIQYVGGAWVNNHRRWEPVVTDTGSGPELVFTDGDIVMTWADYS